jgi:sigma-B regulation protein RsbU (phosphoserine phosphatase)
MGLFFALMAVYAGANAFQTFALMQSRPGWAVDQRDGRFVIIWIGDDSPASILRVGDEIVALNNEPLTSSLQATRLWRTEPGTPYTIVVRRDGRLYEHRLPTVPLPGAVITLFRLLYIVIPVIFLVSGLIVFVLKPNDKQALLLALMFGMFIPEGVYASYTGLPVWLTAVLLAGLMVSNFFPPVFFHLFLIFPERSPLLRRFPHLESALYAVYGLPWAYFATLYVLKAFAPESALAVSSRLPLLDKAAHIFGAGYILAGLGTLLINYRQASRLSRRKMRVVVIGCLAGIMPALLLFVVAYFLFSQSRLNPTLMQWFSILSVLAFLLIPLSFAYAIVRHQVIPVRLIIRRGIRYVFVSSGSMVLEVVTVGLTLTFLMNFFFTRYYRTASGLVIGVVSGVVSIIVWNATYWLHHRIIAPVIDRRFFRRAYNAQQILADLGQALRVMPDTREVTSLVSAKVQDALQTDNVTIFLRDEATGDYACAISSQYVADARTTVVDARRDLALPQNAFVVGKLREMPQPLVVDFDDPDSWAHRLHSANASLNWAHRREGETLRAIRSALLLPVATKDDLLGIISLGPRLGDLPFSREDKQMLMSVALQMALAIENARLVQRRAEEERLQRELAMATEVQQRLFPERPPEVEGLELAGVCYPARGVGGDYYDFLTLDGGQVGIAVADVAGKGMSAALLMSTVQALLRSRAPISDGRLTDLVSTMNKLLRRSTGAQSYATFFYAQFDPRKRALTYVNAGHNPPLLVRAGAARRKLNAAQIEEPARRLSASNGAASVAVKDTAAEAPDICLLTTGGPVIGLFDYFTYEQEMIRMESGDVLVAYTDGVTEAFNRNEEEYGEERLRRAVEQAAGLPASAIIEQIVEDVRQWSADAPQYDDITLVVMKVK